MPVIMKHREL